MPLQLPELPYAYDALRPVIDEETMKIHHTKHHQAYVTNYNNAEKSATEALAKGDFKAVVQLTGALNFNGGGHANHSLFWEIMCKPETGGTPAGDLLAALQSTYGGFDKFKEVFAANTVAIQGSGWGWLCWNPASKNILITTTPNQDNPVKLGLKPILGLDVWEHAYYLNYKNERARYVTEWWKVVNWGKVGQLLQQARG